MNPPAEELTTDRCWAVTIQSAFGRALARAPKTRPPAGGRRSPRPVFASSRAMASGCMDAAERLSARLGPRLAGESGRTAIPRSLCGGTALKSSHESLAVRWRTNPRHGPRDRKNEYPGAWAQRPQQEPGEFQRNPVDPPTARGRRAQRRPRRIRTRTRSSKSTGAPGEYGTCPRCHRRSRQSG